MELELALLAQPVHGVNYVRSVGTMQELLARVVGNLPSTSRPHTADWLSGALAPLYNTSRSSHRDMPTNNVVMLHIAYPCAIKV